MPCMDRWDAASDIAASGVAFLVYGLLDAVVDGHYQAVVQLDDAVDELEDRLFERPRPRRPAEAGFRA